MEKKYPVLKCNEKLWNEIKPVLESFGITDFNNIGEGDENNFLFEKYPYLVSNYGVYHIDKFLIGNVDKPNVNESNSLRYLVNTKEEFLSAITKLLEKDNDFDKNKQSNLNIDKDMEKINIADKLKYCKKGTKLYSPIFGEVEFDGIENNAIYVNTINNDNKIVRIPFESNGQFYSCYPNGEYLLFPSKDNRDWNNFQVLKKGHLVMCADYIDTWQLRKYISDNIAGVTNSNFENESTSWKYIVPIEDFDFSAEDITINKEKSIV